MVNTNMFHHPKYYKELRKRNKLDQAISLRAHAGECARAPDPGHKQQASSAKQQATSSEISSNKLQAPSNKPQASSRKQQAAR